MITIHYDEYEFRTRKEKGRELIFDGLRKIWIALTPEEWVRQNFIRYLLDARNYPATLVAVEKKIMLGELVKRFDVLVYDRNHKPWMMVECKAMDVPLNEAVLDQVLRYMIAVPVPYLVITNGVRCMAFQKLGMQLVALEDIPVFEQ